MRKISDTIARLSALKALHGSMPAAGGAVPSRLDELSGFGSNPGALDGWFFVPGDAPARLPLVVVLHGCTQDAAGYDHHSGWSRLAEEAGFALVFAQQRRGNNPNLCFNWFLPGDTRRDAGEVASIRQMIDAMVAAHDIDRERIFVTGLSAGGAMAASALATHPDLFAGGAIVAGLAHGTARTVPEAFDRMRGHGLPSQPELQSRLRAASGHRGPWPRISIWQGTADRTVAPVNAEAIAAQWRGVHGVGDAPSRTRTTGVVTRQVWSDPAGEAVIELNIVAGMGHGTPIARDLGKAGPFVLDVGVSSTREIARFWGIAGTAGETAPRAERPASASRALVPVPAAHAADASPQAASPSEPARAGSGSLQKVLEDAFRAAGLMR